MNTLENQFSNYPDDNSKKRSDYNDVESSNDDIGENTEMTPLAKAVQEDEEAAREKENALENNKPGATNENKNDMMIPTVTPDNDNLIAGPDGD